MTHPSAIKLEAFACGEPSDAVSSHVGSCEACRAYVEKAQGLAPTVDVGPRLAQAKAKERGRGAVVMLALAAPLAIAAAAVLLVRSPEKSAATVTEPTASVAALAPPPEPDTTFKGGLQLAIVRERDGAQQRFTTAVHVRPGDRVRVEVALDRSQAILGAVLGDDGSWLEILGEGVRDAGTHFSESSVRVDAQPLSGTLVVGPPEAVRRARATRSFEGVRTLRLEWEAR